MPVKTDATTPKHLKPFLFHGVGLQWREGDKNAHAPCPFCGKEEEKFGVKVETGEFFCFVCGVKGNVTTFLRQLWEESDKATKDYSHLAKERKLLFPETLMLWGACQSIITGEWLLPGKGVSGKVDQLYHYVKNLQTKRMELQATAEVGHGIYLCPGLDPKKPIVYVCEGPWDAMALWEVLRFTKSTEEGLEQTASEAASLLAEANVVGVPGALIFREEWCNLFAGKDLRLMYDSDHPRKNKQTGKLLDPVGWHGMKRATGILGIAEQPPQSISYLKWGKDGYDPKEKSGYDVRDHLTGVLQGPNELTNRIAALDALLLFVQPVPADWIPGRSKATSKNGGTEIECVPCNSWEKLVNSWRKAMKWIEGLDRGLSCILASILGTGSVGSQLWMMIVGPASCGKSTLAEAVSINKKHVKALSTIRGFHSGYDDGSKDNKSLILKLKGKTLVTKDGDTLLTAPNKEQIFAEARDLFDKTARSDYRTGMGMDHRNVNMTWLLMGTAALHTIDQSELGARFLTCVIMEGVDEDLEREINRRVFAQGWDNLPIRANCSADTQLSPELLKAYQLTGGYIDYLHDNAAELLAEITITEENIEKIIDLATFVAYIRSRPSVKQEETTEREMSARLVEQHLRLARCLAVVLSRKAVDEEVMRRVARVSLDTARGRTMRVTKVLYAEGEAGAELGTVALQIGETDDKARGLIQHLRKIGAVEVMLHKVHPGIRGHKRWKLSSRLMRLCRSVFNTTEEK